jgi:hypothetical protein
VQSIITALHVFVSSINRVQSTVSLRVGVSEDSDSSIRIATQVNEKKRDINEGKGDATQAGSARETQEEMHRRRVLLVKREDHQRREEARKSELARDTNNQVLSQKEGAGTEAYMAGQAPADIQNQQLQYEQAQLLHAQHVQSQQMQAQQVPPHMMNQSRPPAGRDQGTPPERRYGEGRASRGDGNGGGGILN